MDTDELDGTVELDTTAVLRMIQEDLASTSVRKALEESAKARGHEGAETVYRSVATLRDCLRPEAQEGLALCFEWAREGIVRRTAGHLSPELKALHAAYGYARDVMLETAKSAGAQSKP
jgi:hypothetical protein